MFSRHHSRASNLLPIVPPRFSSSQLSARLIPVQHSPSLMANHHVLDRFPTRAFLSTSQCGRIPMPHGRSDSFSRSRPLPRPFFFLTTLAFPKLPIADAGFDSFSKSVMAAMPPSPTLPASSLSATGGFLVGKTLASSSEAYGSAPSPAVQMEP